MATDRSRGKKANTELKLSSRQERQLVVRAVNMEESEQIYTVLGGRQCARDRV